jgi:hypothetical protein
MLQMLLLASRCCKVLPYLFTDNYGIAHHLLNTTSAIHHKFSMQSSAAALLQLRCRMH